MARVASVLVVLLIVALAGWLLMSAAWTSTPQPAPKPAAPKAAEKYALDWDAKVEPAAFDAKRAMGYLKDICDIGPRMSGTDAMKKQQELMEKHFKALGGQIIWQKFKATQTSVGRPTEMANLIVSWKPDEKRRIILCSHYDTRPIADQEPKRELRSKPIISANDGGSGVALMMELAHQMPKLPLNVGVDFVFFDGEEFVFNRDDTYFFGSKFFADEYRKTRKETGVVYQGAILLDMIAGKNLRLPVERNSWWMAPALVKDIYKIAEQLQAGGFKSNEFSQFAVEDDHLALNRGGIPAVDLIDFDYVHWHRLSDVPENCSGENMEQVARVVSVWMQRVK
jgi:glutaminyl-peptide cyclotransferase